MIPVFCINLERAVARRAKIQREWIDRRGVPIRFWKACDRREIVNGTADFPYDADAALRRWKRPMTDGEIACSASHGRLCEHILAEGFEEAIVMEDDVEPAFPDAPTFFAKVATAASLFPADAVFLHRTLAKFRFYEQNDHCWLLQHYAGGNMCIYYRQTALRTMAEQLRTGQFLADKVWNVSFTPTRRVSLIKTPLAIHRSRDTYIGNLHRRTKRRYFE